VQDDLEKIAGEAILNAADRLGVDPYRLARFLGHGRIADFLQALGRAETLEMEKQESDVLKLRFDDFVREEQRLGPGPESTSDTAKKGR
jgi:hypothetical protein